MRQIAVVAVLMAAICALGFAQGYRVEMGWTGTDGYVERRAPSSDHPLQYYLAAQRQQEFLRAETDNCAVAPACSEAEVEVSQKEIGAPFGKKIFQIVYAMKTQPGDSGGNPANRPYWKSIIAESSRGLFQEIFLLKNEGGFWQWPASNAEVNTAGDAKVLLTNDSTSSRDLFCTGEFWVLEKSGPRLADFSAVEAAIHKAVPTGAHAITPMCSAVMPEKLQVRAVVQKIDAECRACGLEGYVLVKFEFEGSRAVPLSSKVLKDGKD